MDELKNFFKYPQVSSVLGVILIFSAFLEVMGIAILFIKVKLSFGILILGIYHSLKGMASFLDES